MSGANIYERTAWTCCTGNNEAPPPINPFSARHSRTRTRRDSAAGNVRPAFSANVDDDFSIAGADLQRDEAIDAFGVTAEESTDIAAHRDQPS